MEKHHRFGVGVGVGEFGERVALGFALFVIFVEMEHRLIDGGEILEVPLQQEEDGRNLVQEKLDDEGLGQTLLGQVLEQQEEVVAEVEVGFEGVVLGSVPPPM